MGGSQSETDRRVSQPIGIVSAVACLLIVIVRGGNPVAIKVVLQALSPMQGAFTRAAMSCAGIGIYALARGTELRPRRSELAPLAILSLMYGFQIGANQTGADFTSPVFVAILFNTYPIVTNLVSSLVVAEDRLNTRRLLGLAVAFAGVTDVFLSRPSSALAPNPLLGNSLVLAGSSLLAVRVVYLRQLVLRVDSVKAVFWPLLGSLPLFLLGWALIPETATRSETNLTIWLALAFQGVVVGGVGQLAWVYLIRRHTPGTVTAFSFITPVSGLALSSLYFQEAVPPTLLAGFAAVLIGIALAVRRAEQVPAEPPAPPRAFGGSA